MTSVLEIVLENIMNHNMAASVEIGGLRASITDTDTLMLSRSLWRLVVQRTIIERIQVEVVRRKLIPITIHTLCALLLDSLKPFA